MYIMDDNERTNANNFKKLQEKQMRQATRHRNAAQTELQQLSSVTNATSEIRDLARLHLVAANILETSAAPGTRPEQQYIFDAAAEAVQQALTKMREVHGRTFTPEAGAQRKKTKSRKSRRKHKKTKHRKSRRKHKKTKQKRRR